MTKSCSYVCTYSTENTQNISITLFVPHQDMFIVKVKHQQLQKKKNLRRKKKELSKMDGMFVKEKSKMDGMLLKCFTVPTRKTDSNTS
jgi:hypothetical protein